MDGDWGRGWREYLPRRVTFFQAIGLLLERYKHVSMLIQVQVVLVGGGLDGIVASPTLARDFPIARFLALNHKISQFNVLGSFKLRRDNY
jgi:hypothetical protein